MTVTEAYNVLYTVVLTVIGLSLCAVVIKTILGPRITDRLLTINSIGTLVTSSIAVLSAFLDGEEYLIDVCIIYVLISFVSVVVFTNVYINDYLKRNKTDLQGKDDEK